MEQTTRIFPHPLRGTDDVRSERIVHMPCEIRAAEGSTEERPILRIVSTSGKEDRHGSKIRLSAWRTQTYMRTGHVLWQHDAVPEFPYVGKTLSLTEENGTSVAEIELLIKPWRHLAYNLPAFLWESFRDYGMGAISRGFIPLDLISMRASTIPTELAENVEYTDVEMTEQSFVNVPSNRDSFARGIDRAKTRGVMNDHLAKMLGFDVEPYEINTNRGQSMSKLERTRAFRAIAQSELKRCGETAYYPVMDALSEDQKAADLASIKVMVAALVPVMDAALAAFRSTSSNVLRSFASSIAVNAIYNLESLLWRAKEWYGVELEIDDGLTDEALDVENIIEAADALAMSRAAANSEIAVGDRVVVRDGADHGNIKAGSAGEVAEIGSAALGIRFDDMPDMVHRWYTAEELTLESGDEDRAGNKKKPMSGMVMKSFANSLRAGAVFSRKNLEKIDQVISLMGDLRSAATKPTAEDVPDEERSLRETFEQWCERMANEDDASFAARMKRVADAMATRMAGPHEFGSTQVNIEGDTAEAILALGAKIPDEAIAEKGRETDVHATVKFGLDAATTPDQVAAALAGAKAGTMTLGATNFFEADEYDVVYVSVESPDLVALNKIISESLPVTDTYPEYVPHVTLAYVQKGQGAEIAKSLGDELSGTAINFDSIMFSDTEGNLTEIPLAGESGSSDEPPAEDEGERGIRVFIPEPVTISIRVNDSGAERNEQRSDDLISVLVPDASRGRSDDSSNPSRQHFVSLLAD